MIAAPHDGCHLPEKHRGVCCGYGTPGARVPCLESFHTLCIMCVLSDQFRFSQSVYAAGCVLRNLEAGHDSFGSCSCHSSSIMPMVRGVSELGTHARCQNSCEISWDLVFTRLSPGMPIHRCRGAHPFVSAGEGIGAQHTMSQAVQILHVQHPHGIGHMPVHVMAECLLRIKPASPASPRMFHMGVII